MAAAEAKDIKLGRKPKLAEHQRQVAAGSQPAESARSIANDLGVHHAQVLGAA